MHNRGLCRRAVSVRLSVCRSVTFVYSIETNKHISKFHCQGTWRQSQHSSFSVPNVIARFPRGAPPLTGVSNAGGIIKNRDSRPISGFIGCCQRWDRSMLYTQLRRTSASWWRSSLVERKRRLLLISVDGRHPTFLPNPCTRFWVILLTDRQTDKRRQTHSLLLCRG